MATVTRAGQGRAKARSEKHYVALTHGCQEPNYLGY